MEFSIRYAPDVKLEDLRSVSPPRLELEVKMEEWIKKTAGIQFIKALQNSSGKAMFTTLRRFIDGTSLDAPGNWKHFAALLGFDYLDIQKFENFASLEGVTGPILERYAKWEYSTVGTILKVLLELGRMDILHEISSDIEGLMTEDYRPSNTPHVSYDRAHDSESGHSLTFTGEPLVDDNVLQQPPVAEAGRAKRPKVVLLTFSLDGREKAFEVAKVFRENRIGVIIWEENASELVLDPWNTVHKYFGLVHFVIPIVTKGYVTQLSSEAKKQEAFPMPAYPDASYVRFIYNLMFAEYVRSGCRNYRVRPLLDDSIVGETIKYSVLTHPIFFHCHRVSEAANLVKVIRNSKLQRPS